MAAVGVAEVAVGDVVMAIDDVAGLETQVEQAWAPGGKNRSRAGARRRVEEQTLSEKRSESMSVAERQLSLADARWRAQLSAEGPPPEEGMGRIERDLLSDTLGLQAAALRRKIQRIADQTPDNCPVCGAPLQAVQWCERAVYSRFGEVRFSRAYGYCPKCEKRFFPADHVLKLPEDGKNSPEMGAQMQLMGAVVPPAQAAQFSHKVYGFEVDASRIVRELERAGRIARRQRESDDERALDTQGRWEVTEEIRGDLPEKFILCIQYDGFMGRERDHWGQTQAMRRRGEEVKRYHEIKAATFFVLDARVTCGGQRRRPVILRRRFLATRAEAYEFGRQLYAEAVRQGLLLADEAYIVADGAAWIWNLADDRFPTARKTLDFYHAAQHLEALSVALHGQGDKARQWAKRQKKRLREGQDQLFVNSVERLAQILQAAPAKEVYADDESVLREWEYFNRHRGRLDYAAKAERGLPIGSGCIESTCKQYQLRVKRMGQFWLQKNLEGMLLLYSRHLSFLWN